jgi:hypothetical protein
MQSSDCSNDNKVLMKDLSVSQNQVGDREHNNNVWGGKRNTGGAVSMTSKSKSKVTCTVAQKKPSPQNDDGDDEEEEEYIESSKTLKSKNNKRKAGKAQKPCNKDDDERTSKSKTHKVAPPRKVRLKVAAPRQHNKEDKEDNVAPLNDAALHDVNVEEEDNNDIEEEKELKRQNQAQKPWSLKCMKQFENTEGKRLQSPGFPFLGIQ